jgi:hypothetical protein
MHERVKQAIVEVRPILEALDRQRIASRRAFVAAGSFLFLACLAGSGAMIYLHHVGRIALSSDYVFGLSLAAVMFWPLALGVLHQRLTATWRCKLSDVLNEVLRKLDPGLQLEASGLVGAERFGASRLFPARHNKYCGEDLIYGSLAGILVECCQLEVKDTRGLKTSAERMTLFHGFFCVAELERRLASPICFLPKWAGPPPSGARRWFRNQLEARSDETSPYGSPVALEDPVLETWFQVHCTREDDVHRLIFRDLMDRMANFMQATGKDVRLGIIERTLYLAVSDDTDLFHPALSQSVADEDWVMRQFENLMLLRDLLATLRNEV